MKIALCFSGLPRGNYKENIEKHHMAFDGDLFLSTWEGVDLDVMKFPEPESDYLQKHAMRLKNPYKQTIMGRGYKQIVAHALSVLYLPDEYDLVVRCRYDVLINQQIKWMDYARQAYESKTVLGIRKQVEDEWDYLKEVKPKGLVLDQMIIHRRDQFDPTLALKLFYERKLEPCEMGWYQTFQSHRIKNYIGGCRIER